MTSNVGSDAIAELGVGRPAQFAHLAARSMHHKADTEGELDASDADTKFQEALARAVCVSFGHKIAPELVASWALDAGDRGRASGDG